jgi:Ca-activated chloride channel family protein
MKASFWTLDKAVDQELRFDVTLKTAFPVDGLHCPSHPGFHADQVDEQTWKGVWTASDVNLDRDFSLYYRLAPDLPARVEVLTHRREGDSEGTFMAVVTPGSDLAPVEQGTDWAFVLDVSGSMQGEKIRVLNRGVAKAIQGLGPNDRIHVIAFNESPHAVTRGWVDVAGRPAAAQAVQGLQAGGSTNIHAALELAYRSLDADRPAAVILVSDGVANTGPHHYRDFIELARGHDVRLFTFVIGNSANQRLLGDLATLSHGFAKTVSVQDEIGAHLLLANDRMSHQAMHGARFELEGATVRHPKTLPSLYLGQQLVVFGRYDRTGGTTLKVSAKISGTPATWELPVNLPAVDDSNPELERLYALAAIADLEREAFLRTGDGGEAKDAITDMAIRYSLVTDYTSMVVVEKARKAEYGLTDANANRRIAEREAAARRARAGNTVQTVTGQQPLAGRRAAHAPTRAAQRRASGGGGGGGGGAGAIGPLYLLPAAGLAWLAMRRRRRRRRHRGIR